FFFSAYYHHLDLHSFPTRRSSDLSGQIALDTETGELVLDSIEKETTVVMENLKAILEEAGTSFKNVLKATIFISDMDNFGKINRSEEHTSELQSRENLVCRLLLEK